MTLQNMRYIIAVAEHRSVSKAAAALFMTQSALSASIRDAEEELGIRIFLRTNRGVVLTADGEDCLRYCQEIVERSDRFVARYKNRDTSNTYFSVSSQHLPFAVRAFDELLATTVPESYSVGIYEEATTEVIQDVGAGKSEFGILAITEEQGKMLQKVFLSNDLSFTPLAVLKTYVFLRKEHPLGQEAELSMAQLSEYPYVTYEHSADPVFFTEETALYEPLQRCIHVRDRATKMSVIRSSDAFSIGVDLPNFNRDVYFQNRSTELIAVPFSDQAESIQVGYLEKNNHIQTEIGGQYLALLKKHIRKLSLPGT